MLWRSGGGILEKASLEVVRWRVMGRGASPGVGSGAEAVGLEMERGAGIGAKGIGAGKERDGGSAGGGVLVEAAPSNFAARDAVLDMEVPRVLSHGGGLADALLVVVLRRGVCDGVGVSVGLRGELVGVEGRTVEGEGARGEFARRKGEARGLLKDSGEGL
jgi:hypothetical protein